MELRCGKNLLAALGRDELVEPVESVASRPGKAAVPGALAASLRAAHDAPGLSRENLAALAEKTSGAKTILALGDGPALAAGRWAAAQNHAHLILVPFPIADERAVSGRVVYEEGGIEKAVGEKSADLLLVDYSLIWGPDEHLTRAAAGELLAVSVAVQDLRIGEPESFSEDRAQAVLELVDELFDWADDIYDLTEPGIKKLVDLLVKREDLAAALGSRRWIEGSEKIFCAAAARILGRDFPPGPLKCLAVILLTEFQGLNSRPIKQFLHWLQVPYQPEKVGLNDQEISRVLAALPDFAKEHDFPRTSLDALEMSDRLIERAVRGLRDPLIKNSFQKRSD